jgi:hypothetical protein
MYVSGTLRCSVCPCLSYQRTKASLSKLFTVVGFLWLPSSPPEAIQVNGDGSIDIAATSPPAGSVYILFLSQTMQLLGYKVLSRTGTYQRASLRRVFAVACVEVWSEYLPL